MLPWLTKRRDAKAGSKQAKQQEQLTTPKRGNDAGTSLAKAFSLRRSRSKSKPAPFENEFIHGERQTVDIGGISSSGNESDPSKSGQDTGNLPSPALTQSNALKVHVVPDTELEELAFLSETSSTFGSEMSSADSSVSSKGSSSEESPQGGHLWQQHNANYALANLENELIRPSTSRISSNPKVGSTCVTAAPRLSQESARLEKRVMQSEQTCMPFPSVIGEKSGALFSTNTRSTNMEFRNSCPSTMNACLNDASNLRFKSKLHRDSPLPWNHANDCAVDQKMPPSVRSAKREVNSFQRSETRGDKDRAIPSQDSNPAVKCCSLQMGASEASASWQNRRDATAEIDSDVYQTSSGGCDQSISAKLQRRSRRGSSISANLPPDLQGLVGDSLAFVKISEDPYEDFKQSMYEMIMEKDLEESVDVEELLYCYLSLNSPRHHDLIQEVFSDVWSSVLMPIQ